MGEDTAEIFDDLYLGIRAGGALRKQRRGEELTHEEKEALSRWQRLSTARKAAAIGAFAFGTFGLGFTLGGELHFRGTPEYLALLRLAGFEARVLNLDSRLPVPHRLYVCRPSR